MPSIYAFHLVLFFAVAFALIKGGAPERLAAWGQVVLVFLQYCSTFVFPPQHDAVNAAGVAVDAAALILLGAIALSAMRIWPLWAAALQLFAISAHFARWAEVAIEPYVYVLMTSVPTGGALILLIIGTENHRSRMRKYGSDPDWVDWKAIGLAG